MIAADLRAFAAAARKEWRQLRRYPTLYAGLLFWPILLPSVFVLQGQAFSGGEPRALQAFAERTGTASVAGFVFVGWSMYMWLSIVLWNPGTSLRNEQIRGSLEALFLTPASRMVVLFGPSTAYLATALWMFAVVAVALRFVFGVALEPVALVRALVVCALTVPAMYAIGALTAMAVLRFGEVNGIVQAIRSTFTLACGVTFPIVLLPEWARAVALALPPTYFVADVRAVLLAGAELASLTKDLAVLAGLGAIACALTALAFGAMERGARRSGMLGSY